MSVYISSPVLRIEARTPYMLGKYHSAELHSQPFLFCFETSQPQIQNPPASVSRVAEMAGLYKPHHAYTHILNIL